MTDPVPPALRALVDATHGECSCSVPTATIVATLRAVAEWWEEVGARRPVIQVSVMTSAILGVADAIEKEASHE